MKNFRVILSTTALLIILFFTGLYFAGSNSEPYRAAEQFVVNNNVVNKYLTGITHTRMAYLGYSVNYIGSKGNAEFEIIASSPSDTASVFVTLDRELGQWKVTNAYMKRNDGKSVKLVSADKD